MAEMTLEEAIRTLRENGDEENVASSATCPDAWRVVLAHTERTLAAREGEPSIIREIRSSIGTLGRWTDQAVNALLDHIDVLVAGHEHVSDVVTRQGELLDTITAENAALRARCDAVDAACLAVCSDNTPDVLGDAVDPDLGRYLCLNENGDELIDTDDPADVVRALHGLWGRVSEKLGEVTADRDTLRARVEAVRKLPRYDFGEYVRIADVLAALEGRADA